jgi:hypothetical protein
MNETSLAVLQIVGRVAVVVLCYYAVTKVCGCRSHCELWRHRLQSVLGWLSGIVACAGLFFPIIGGAAAIVLVAAIWLSELNYGFEAQTISFPTSRSTASDGGSGGGR